MAKPESSLYCLILVMRVVSNNVDHIFDNVINVDYSVEVST